MKLRLGLVLLLTLVLLPDGARAAEERPIQPGASVSTVVGQCTMNFVFRDNSGALYVGTAGHCTRAVGDRASASGGSFGSVVWRSDQPPMDFALIKVDTARYGDVEPSMRHWGGPTGVTTAGETAAGDLLYVYGYGIVFGVNSRTRPRAGALLSDSDQEYVADTGAVNGDSGAPLIHAATGKALGVISRYNFGGLPPSTDVGPTIEFILKRLAQDGRALTLVTA